MIVAGNFKNTNYTVCFVLFNIVCKQIISECCNVKKLLVIITIFHEYFGGTSISVHIFSPFVCEISLLLVIKHRKLFSLSMQARHATFQVVSI